MGRPLQGKDCIELSGKSYAAETLRVIRPPRGLNFKLVTQALQIFVYFRKRMDYDLDRVLLLLDSR